MIQKDKKILTIPCNKVSVEESQEIIKILEDKMILLEKNGNPAVGLAANQVFIDKHVAIVRVQLAKGQTIKINLVNARIIEQKESFLFKDEGCLSFPGDKLTTSRYNEIAVENDVYPTKFVATGLLAVIIQHELDHLNGITFFERVQK